MTETDTTLALLRASLEVAVPLWQMELKARSFASIVARAQELAQVIAEKGDVILYRGKKKGESAKAFNALAEGVAALSYAPGGVRIFGLHFEETHPECNYGAPLTPTMVELTSAILASIDRVRIEE